MRIIGFLVPFFFGLVGILSFAPFSIKVFIFISYAYLIYLIISNDKNTLLKLFFWGAGHWGFGMSWIIVSVYYYGETTIAMSLVIFLLLVITLSLVFTCPIYAISKLLNISNFSNNFNKSLFISAMLMLIEFTRYYFLNGVPWLIPGNIFLDTLTQNIYSILGVSATSLLIYLLCCNLVLNKKNKFSYVIIFLMIISIVPDNKTEEINDGIKIAVVQPASDPFLKYKENYYYEIEQKILDLVISLLHAMYNNYLLIHL